MGWSLLKRRPALFEHAEPQTCTASSGRNSDLTVRTKKTIERSPQGPPSTLYSFFVTSFKGSKNA